jgi:hypothetical protein
MFSLASTAPPAAAASTKSTDGGTTWTPFSAGLPNAPVFEISIDETHGRIYAATHDRGAYVLSKGFISNFEGCLQGGLRDIPVYGQNFLPNQACTVQLLQSNGEVCASGTVDVMGGAIKTDSNGVLTTDKTSLWEGKPVAWACFDGTCLGGTPISACSDDADGDGDIDPLSTIVVACGGELAVARSRAARPSTTRRAACSHSTSPASTVRLRGPREEPSSSWPASRRNWVLARSVRSRSRSRVARTPRRS